MPSHRGEIAFPGGGLHVGIDATPLDTALREAEEEIGLRPELVDVVAELDTIGTVASRFTITPFVGLLDGRPELRPDPREVVAILEVPLAELLDDAVYREEHWGADFTISFFELVGETVWGATGPHPHRLPRPPDGVRPGRVGRAPDRARRAAPLPAAGRRG